MKAFKIIEALDEAGDLSIAELSATLSMDKGTVHRLVNTIKEAGYIIQDKNNKRYENSVKIFAIGQRVIAKTNLREISRPYLEQLAKDSGETINLSVFSGTEITYIDKIESLSPLKIAISVGTRLPVHCTGMGKAILAFLESDELEEILNSVEYVKLTPNTAGSKEELMERLAQVKAKGYSMDNEEFLTGLISFAAPIFDFHDQPIAALSLSSPKMRFDPLTQGDLYRDMVVNTAAEISKKMGHKL